MREGKPVILTHTNFAGTPLTEREIKTRNKITAEGEALPKRSVDVFGGLCERWGEHVGGLRAAAATANADAKKWRCLVAAATDPRANANDDDRCDRCDEDDAGARSAPQATLMHPDLEKNVFGSHYHVRRPKTTTTKMRAGDFVRRVRASHWFPYDRVRVVNAVS